MGGRDFKDQAGLLVVPALHEGLPGRQIRLAPFNREVLDEDEAKG
jgi:hypothetical protein